MDGLTNKELADKGIDAAVRIVEMDRKIVELKREIAKLKDEIHAISIEMRRRNRAELARRKSGMTSGDTS